MAWILCCYGCGVSRHCSTDSTPSLGTSICSWCSPKKTRNKTKQNPNICILRVPDIGEKTSERIFETILAKKFANLMENINLHIQETQQTSGSINPEQAIRIGTTAIKLSKRRGAKTEKHIKETRTHPHTMYQNKLKMA